MKTEKQTDTKNESKASAHQSPAKTRASAFTHPQSGAMTFTAKTPELSNTAEPIQLFPFQVTHKDSATSFIAKLEGSYIRLYNRAQEEVAYFQIQVTAHDWGMKNIYVHGGGLQGMGVGTLLLHFAAQLAQNNGVTQLTVLTPSGQNLWTNNGFTATPTPGGVPDITATPAQVLHITGPAIQAAFTISNYPAQPAKQAPAAKDPRRNEDRENGPGGMFEL